jgi:hypothetical protein
VRYARSFGVGFALAAVILVVAAISGAAEGVFMIDVSFAGIGLVLAGAIALGMNLGNPIAVRSLDDYGRPVDSPGAAARLALGSLGLYAGAFVSALIAG